MAPVRLATVGPLKVLGYHAASGGRGAWIFFQRPDGEPFARETNSLSFYGIVSLFAEFGAGWPAALWPLSGGRWDIGRAVCEIEDAAWAAGEVDFQKLGFELVRDESPRWIMVRRQ